MLTFYAGSLPHFADHLLPIYLALPSDIRGQFHAGGRAAQRAREFGVNPVPHVPGRRRGKLVVVASYHEYRSVAPSPVVLVNHGMGQTYLDGRSPESYSGGPDRERVILYLCPSERDAEVNRVAYPGAQAVAVGVPKMDPWHSGYKLHSDSSPPTIVFSFHADLHAAPETRWAFPHYRQAIIDLVRSGEYRIIGHGHPRMKLSMQKFWSALKVPHVQSFASVLDQAHLFICDTSSAIYEFASTDRPVVVLDAPWYRREVNHGGRFWEWADVGIRISQPEDLPTAIKLALEDPSSVRHRREEIIRQVYLATDGQATKRAVTALLDLVNRELP